MRAILAELTAGRDLAATEMERAVGMIMDGEATGAQVGAFLAALRMKGETKDELVAAVRAMRARAVKVDAGGPLLDTCGTGGDGLGTFNISTATAFVAATAGARVAKHGNRAASGKVGAADVLEALGAVIDGGPEVALRCLDQAGVCFMFAPVYHPAVKNVAVARREVAFRTLFNLTGPLCNPAGASRQLLGLFSPDWLVPVAEALRELGSERALVVHGGDGSDEVSAVAPTAVVELSGGEISEYTIDPAEFGISVAGTAELDGGDADTNAGIIREVLGGGPGPRSDAVALNAGAALVAAGLAGDMAGGVEWARSILSAGEALGTLERFVTATQGP